MLPRKEILKVKPYIPGKPIAEVKRQFKLRRAIKLASNENSLGPSPKALKALKKALNDVNRYPDGGCFYLKRKLAKRLSLLPNRLIFGCGSDEIIVLAIRTFVNPGDEVIIAKPTFLIYQLAATCAGAKIKFVPLKNFRYDLPAMKKQISSKTKMVFIANPDNPTGTYVNKNELNSFMRSLSPRIIIYIDEAYRELVDKKDFPDGLRYLKRGNVIVARTFSKAYGLSGLRIGYGISSSENISYMDRAREPFNVTSLAQTAALAALDDQAHILGTRKLLKQGKAYLYREFNKLNLKYVESATNFIVVKIGPRAKSVYQRLLKKGIIVREMSAWGLSKFLRVTVGTMPENRRFIQALKEIIRGGRG